LTSSSGTNTVTWTETGTVTSRTLTQQRGPIVAPGTCAGVSWKTTWSNSTFSSPFTTAGYLSGWCYRYTVTVMSAGGSTTASSGNLLISPPPVPAASFTSPAQGQTVTSTSGTNTVTWTESDGGGQGIVSRTLTQQRGQVVAPGTCTGVAWATTWSNSTFTSPFTTAGYASGWCYRYTVTVRNGAGGTASASSGELLITS
jgi:hypothetical protein